MVALKKVGRKVSRKIDLRFAQSEDASREGSRNIALIRNLGATAGTDNEALLTRMVALGVNFENLSALRCLPIARVAWGSGRVTEHERLLAMSLAISSGLISSAAAVQTFRGWLKKRPSDALWSLWGDYTTELLSKRSGVKEKTEAEKIHQIATRVAFASGGLLDQGGICGGEQRVLDEIARVYMLDEVAA